MCWGNGNNGCIWLIIIIVLLFSCGNNGCGCGCGNNDCGCGGNNDCGCC